MKTVSFGFAPVVSSFRSAGVTPQLIATSTNGGFRVTSPVTRALGIAAGENIVFVNNIASIDNAITAKDETLVAFIESKGLEFGTPEANVAIHNEFDQWLIAKSYPIYNTNGLPKMTTERITKKQKVEAVLSNYEDYLKAAIESSNVDEEVVAALTNEDVSKEEKVDILASFVNGAESQRYAGSKTATTSNATGVGLNLNFTDSSVWSQLKQDLGEEATSFNRHFDIDITEVIKVQVHNGFEVVEISAVALGDYTDKSPKKIGGGDGEVEEETDEIEN